MKPSPLIFRRDRLVRIGILTLPFGALIAYLIWGMPAHVRPDFGLLMPLYVGMGAVAGIVYFYTLKRPIAHFYYGVGAYILLLIGVGVGVTLYQSKQDAQRLTCQVCGFRALEAAGDSCRVCGVRLTAAEAQAQGYADLDEYLAVEQHAFFVPTQPDAAIDFYAAHPQGTYIKDSTWRPKVSADELRQTRQLVDSLLR